jgi:hypothetical protein
MTIVSDKSCREIQNIHFMFKNFFPENCALYDNVEKKVEQDRPETTK